MPRCRIGPSANANPIAPRPRLQFRPDPVVRPCREVLVRRTLQIQPAQRRRPHRQQCEAALMADIHVLFGRRRRLGQDTQPTERILALEHAQRAGGDRWTAHPVEAVAARDHVAIDRARGAFMPIADARLVGQEVVHADILGLEHDLPADAKSCSDQVLHHVVLAVDHHMLADEIGEIDAMIGTLEPHHHAGMQHSLRAAFVRRRRSRSVAVRCRIPARRRGCGSRCSRVIAPPARSIRCPANAADATAAIRPDPHRQCQPACASFASLAPECSRRAAPRA